MKKDDRVIFARLFGFLKPYVKQYLFIGLLLMVSTVVGFFQPLMTQEIIDKGLVQKNMPVLVGTASILTILVVIGRFASLYQVSLFANIHNAFYSAISQKVLDKLLHIKQDYFQKRNSDEIQSVLQTDISRVSAITDSYVTSTLGNIFKIISGLAGLLIISWQLTIVIIAIVPIKICIVKVYSKQQEKQTEKYIDQRRSMTQWLGDTISGIAEIKLWGLSKGKQDYFSERQKELLRQEKRITMTGEWDLFWGTIIEWAANISVYIVGGFLMYNNSLSLGTVFAFISYSWFVTGPVSALLGIKMHFARIMPSARRLFQFLDMEVEHDEGQAVISHHTPKIEFKRVGFAYMRDRPVLENVSFHVEPGEKVAIIGQNGSGKSTILNLLLRFYEPDFGEITINEVPVSQLALDQYRSLFSVVSQEPYLFLGDVAGNINLTGNASPDKVAAAMQTSGVADFLKHMPDGEKTQIGRNGTCLSGGEKQKLAVARALLKDAPIVILDEATSAFDVESDAYFHDVIVNRLSDKSVILITHHYENLRGMDRVYKLENGNLTETTVSV